MGKIRQLDDLVTGTDLNPGDYPLGSAESRAAARAAIVPEPCISIMYGRGMDEKMRFARLHEDGSIHERLPGETLGQFRERMLNLPGRARGALLTSYFIVRPHQESESIPRRRKSD